MRAPVLLLLLAVCASTVAAQLGGSCGTVSPSTRCGCCDDGRDIDSDTWCAENYAQDCGESAPIVGDTCSSVSPDSRCDCCDDGRAKSGDPWCSKNYKRTCEKPPPPVVGDSCGSVSPNSRCKCCTDKSRSDRQADEWCTDSYAGECEKPVGTDCGTVSPNSRCKCCSDGRDISSDKWCSKNYSKQCEKPVGTTCGTVNPSDRCQCCSKKSASDAADDSWCSKSYVSQCTKPVGTTCDSVSPNSRCKCCDNRHDWSDETWCQKEYTAQCTTPPPKPVGTTCGTVTPDSRCKCCKQKSTSDAAADSWCAKNYKAQCEPAPPKPVGTTCETVSPDSRCKCCEGRKNGDPWCSKNYKAQCTKPTPQPVGTTCDTVSPDSRCKCCEGKKDWSGQTWCKQSYKKTCEDPEPLPPHDNTKDFPWLAYLESPLGVCGGSLVAPGYVLTAASCVWNSTLNATIDAANVSLWVAGEWLAVASVNVSANWTNFGVPQANNSWDVAMLTLANNSAAQWVGLPTSDVPSVGILVQQTAWEEEGEWIDTAELTTSDTCPPGWADQLCASGDSYLKMCPHDYGSPLLMPGMEDKETGRPLQVGLTAGPPGCATDAENYGYFTRLSDPAVLEQVIAWLNSREGTSQTGLDDAVRAWMVAANEYLQLGAVPAEPEEASPQEP